MPVVRLSGFDCHYLQFDRSDGSLELNGCPKSLIMVHGLATNLAFWYQLAQAFTSTHQVTLFDLRGHGKSSMPERCYTVEQLGADLKHLMDRLEIKTASLVGHSFGGAVALNLSTQYPNRIDRLILADVRLKVFQPVQKPSTWSHWSRLQPALKAAGIDLDENEPEAGYRILTELARLRLRTPNASQDPAHQRLLSHIFPMGNSTRTASQWLKLIEKTTAWEDFTQPDMLSLSDLQQVDCPTLAIYGGNSPTLPTAYALQQLWPNLHLEIVPDAGHFFPISHPQNFVTTVQKFLS